MKKFFSLILALTWILCLATAVSAKTFDNTDSGSVIYEKAPDGSSDWQDSGDVEITVKANINPVYYVTVAWESLEFEYTFGQRQWDPASHTYTNTGA